MTKFLGSSRKLALVLALAGASVPALAQESSADTRLRRLEAEVRDLKRQAGAAGTIAPQATPRTTSPPIPGTPASTPVADLLARMDAIEGQLARLTAQNEESGHKLRLLEERVAAGGFRFDRRAFAPHITLVRKARCVPLDLKMPRIQWDVRNFVLVRSELDSNGSRYVVIGCWPRVSQGEPSV